MVRPFHTPALHLNPALPVGFAPRRIYLAAQYACLILLRNRFRSCLCQIESNVYPVFRR